MQQWLEEGPCESVINGDICGLDIGRRDLIVGSSFGGTANLPECSSGAKQSLVPSCNIQNWKTLGRQVTASAYRSTKHAIVSVNRLLRAAVLPWAHRTRLQQLHPSLLTTNVSNKSGNQLFAQK